MMSDVPPSIVLACARRNPTRRRVAVVGGVAGEARARRPASRPSPSHAIAADALEVDRELLQPLVELGLLQLGDRALGPGLGAALALVGRALVVEPDEPALDVGLREPLAQRAGRSMPRCRSSSRSTGLPPTASPPIEPAPDSETRSFISVVIATCHPSPSRPSIQSSGTRASLKNTSLNSASPVICTQRPHLDAGLLHVDDEVREPAVLRHVGVRCGTSSIPHLRDVRERRPHLLAVDDPLVAVAHRARREPGDVGAGARLAEELAPDLLVASRAAGAAGASSPRCPTR